MFLKMKEDWENCNHPNSSSYSTNNSKCSFAVQPVPGTVLNVLSLLTSLNLTVTL